MNKTFVTELLENIRGMRVAVVGDIILDRYIWGHATRISPEAPVPIVKVVRRTSALGGAANVMRNLAALGATPVAVGVIGDDSAGAEVRTLCQRWDIDTSGIVVVPERPTTVKVRLISDNQQIARIDEEVDEPVNDTVADNLISALTAAHAANRLDAVILEDYNKGVLTQNLAKQVMAFADRTGAKSALDPHPANLLPITGLSLMTPNRPEAFNLAGSYFRDGILPLAADKPLLSVGRKLRERWRPDVLLITLGGAGMAVFHGDEKTPAHIPTAAREVFDVSGAGDTVIAACLAAMTAGLDPKEAAEFANHAAGVVVGKVGTVPITIDELVASFEQSG
jgi:D-beta-D-heptose 7-phosphate kinase/D-beta-D-heptose 1-phosphate adenosyltransferase